MTLVQLNGKEAKITLYAVRELSTNLEDKEENTEDL